MTTVSQVRVEATARQLYALLPAHIRSVDAANGSALNALIHVLASGSAEIDREIDLLYDSMFVETAPEGSLPDMAALVASEPMRLLPAGSGVSQRTLIANTVRYRRGKGTSRVLEALSADVGGFGAVAVEYFMRLARLQHLLDVRAERPSTAWLVPGVTAARTATGFDMLPRLVDFRSIARAAGRHHVRHVGVHVLRPVVPQFAAPRIDPAAPNQTFSFDDLAGVPVMRPWPDGTTIHAGYFQLSAQPGRSLRLFNPDRRSQSEAERVVETDLRDRLRRLPLHLETEERRKAALEGRPAMLGDFPWFDTSGQPFSIFLRLIGASTFTRVKPEEVQLANLEAFPASAGARPAALKSYQWFTGSPSAPVPHTASHPIRCGFDPVTGRLIGAAPSGADPDIEEVRIAYGTGIGRDIGAGPQDRNTSDVPFDITDTDSLVHFVRIVDATKPASGAATANVRAVQTLDTALSEWAASGAGKRGLIVLVRCDREVAAGGGTDIPVAVHPGSELHIISAQWRPKVVKPGVPDNPRRHGYIVRLDRRFTVDAPLRVAAASAPAPGNRAGVLVLDGLELTGGVGLSAAAVSRLLIRHCTVRAPGAVAITTAAALEGAEIVIDRSIVGRVNLDAGSGPATGSVVVTDSIVSSDGGGNTAISAESLDAQLRNVTVFGRSAFKSLEATNVIFTDASIVTRRQSGCVRYSFIPGGSAMPRRFRCQPDLARTAAAAKKGSPLTSQQAAAVALGVTPIFLDTSLDEPTVAMLHPLTRDAIRLGGENDSEMGVFSAAAEGLRLANLASFFDDYVPFGLEAGVIDDTRSTAVALQRNRP
jgi:hypothetical protein